MSQKFDDRSEQNIESLIPAAQAYARLFLSKALAAGLDIKIISGNRTFAEQDALFAKGRTAPGPIVTKARGGFSKHNFGIAWDVGIFKGKKFLEDSPLYDVAGQIGKEVGLEWGGDWNEFVDKPHFQCKTGKTTGELRDLVAKNLPIPIQPLPDQPKVLKVFKDSEELEIPGLFIDGRSWVGVRAFIKVFDPMMDGEILGTGGDPFMVKVRVGEKEESLAAKIFDGSGYVKFADLNDLYRFNFRFESKTPKLILEL